MHKLSAAYWGLVSAWSKQLAAQGSLPEMEENMPFSDNWPFIRECQECGHKAVYKDPATYSSDRWRDVKCKACGSEALDHGSKRPWTAEQKAELDEYYRKQGELGPEESLED